MMRCSGTPVTNVTCSRRPSSSMVRAEGPPSLSRPMTTSSTWRSVRSLATASSRYRRPFMVTSALAVVMSRPGTRSDVGQRAEQVLVDADRHHVEPLAGHLVVAVDVLEGVLRDGDDPGHAARHPGLHPGEAVPAGLGEPRPGGLGVLHLEAAVDGDRVVDGGQHGEARPLHAEQPVAEALVVLHQVEVVDPPAQVLPGPDAEGERLGEGAAHERRRPRRGRRGS